MTFASQFHVYLPWGQRPFSIVLNVKAVVADFNQENVLVGAFSVIVKYSGTFGLPSFEALQFTLPAADPGDTRQLLRRLLMTQISDIWEKY